MPEDRVVPSSGFDHLIYATANLQQGMDEIEALLGVRPVPGGHHPQYGTHNALLSLGLGNYLEIIARDPDLPEPERGAFIDFLTEPNSRLVTWVMRVGNIIEAAQAVNSTGALIGSVESGRRKNPDGSEIMWQVTDPYAMPSNGAIPFLINWGDATHPSMVAPQGGRLIDFSIEHPEPESVLHALAALGVETTVRVGDGFRLCAKIETENGVISLQ